MANTHKSGSPLADQMKDRRSGMEEAADQVKEGAKSVMGKVGEAAAWVGDKADDAASGVGHGLKAVGDTIKDKGPQSGVLGSAASAVGSGLANAGSYLEEKGISGIGKDLADVIRRHPLPSILIGLGLGFMLARLTSSRS